MRHLSKRLILAGIFAFCIPVMGNTAFANDEDSAVLEFLKDIDFSGFVDTYYSYNLNRPDARGPGDGERTNALRSFDVHDNSFTLNNVELRVKKEATEEHPVGFGFTTMYGEQANFITFVDSHNRADNTQDGGQSFTIQEGYVTYKASIGNGIDIKMGKFATWIGAELIESVDNPNYSRSLLYQNAIPFTNTGIAVGYAWTDKLTTTGYIVNGWDTFVDNNTAKTVGYQIAYDVAENLSVYFNASHGAEQESGNDYGATSSDLRHFFDLIIAYSPFDKLAFNLNYDHGTEENVGHWRGISLISQYFFTDAVDLAVRGEYFKDSGSRTGMDFDGDGLGDTIEVYEVTATLNIKVRKNLYVRPEIRYDWASGDKGVFAGSGSMTSGKPETFGRDNQTTAAIGVAYLF
jgi:hypothetical protein